MAITQTMCASFKQDLLNGVQNFGVDTFKIALYTSAATLDAYTTAYTTSNEASGTGYTAGGNILTGTTVSLSGTTAYVSFSNTTWSTTTIATRGALIYNSSKSNKAVAVLAFDEETNTSGGNFTIEFPLDEPDYAIIRIS
jgi:hypothetical protein